MQRNKFLVMLAVIFCFSYSPLHSQDVVIYREPFSATAGMPAGWTQSSVSTNPFSVGFYALPTISSEYYLTMERMDNAATDTVHLYTPFFDCRGQSKVLVQYLEARWGILYTHISVSADSGHTWSLLAVDSVSDIAFKTRVLDVTAYAANQQYVQVRFSDIGLIDYRNWTIDDFEVINPAPMSYTGAEFFQPDTSMVPAGDTSVVIAGLKINTTGKDQSLQLSSVTFTTGSSVNVQDMYNARLFVSYNRTFDYWSNTYEAVADTIVHPNGQFTFTFPTPMPLHQDSTFLFLTYDIAFNPSCGGVYDADMVSFELAGTRIPPVTSFSTNRSMVPCTTIDSIKVTANPSGTIRSGDLDVPILTVKVYKHSTDYIKIDTLVFSTTGCSRTSDLTTATLIYTESGYGPKNTEITFTETITEPNGEMRFVLQQGIPDVQRELIFDLYYNISDTVQDNDTIDAQFVRAYYNNETVVPLVSGLSGQKIIYAYMSGTKTIGSSGNYTSFSQAITELNTRKTAASGVIFDVLGEDFTEAPPLIQFDINNLGGTTVFRKKAGESRNPKLIAPVDTVLTGLLYLYGTDNLTWDGIDIDATAAQASAGIYIRNITSNGATNNTVKNCTILVNPSFSTGYYGIALVSSLPTHARNSNNSFYNLTIGNAAVGIYGSSAITRSAENVVIGTENGGTMRIGTPEYPLTKKNIASFPSGIYLSAFTNFSISNTEISNIEVAASSNTRLAGIRVPNTMGANNRISKNKIHTLIQNDSVSITKQVYGIDGELYRSTAGNRLLIDNNLIYDIRHRQYTPEDSIRAFGIYLSGIGTLYTAETELYHNSVLVDSALGVSSTAIMFSNIQATSRNNIFANASPVNEVSKRSAIVAQTGLQSSYNNYYVPGGTNNYLGILKDSISSTPVNSLSEWQLTLPGDSGTFSTFPGFIARDSLMISNVLSHLPTRGVPVGITTDYWGNTRSTEAPYIGAHEYVMTAALSNMSLRVLLEGAYNPVTGQMIYTDTVTVFLRKSTYPHSVIDSQRVVPSYTGIVSIPFINTYNDTLYYVSIQHKNSIETWAAQPLAFHNRALTYDMTDSANKAYGDNLKLKGDKYCLWGGDINQDGIVDFTDLLIIENDAYNFVSGYSRTDLNGDFFVDFTDLILCDNNAYNVVLEITPLSFKRTGVPVRLPARKRINAEPINTTILPAEQL